MLSLPYNSSTPVLYVNKDALKSAGLDPAMDLSTWEQVGGALDKLKASGHKCPLTTAWQSWVHLENFSAYHNVPFATKDNGFTALDTELSFNGPMQVKHIQAMGDWAKAGKFIYAGRRNEGGANFRAGECAFFTESSAGYAGVKKEAKFAFEIRPLPYWSGAKGAPQNTIIGGSSLWVLGGHKANEYKGVGAFLSFLSSSAIQAKWHQDTGYLPITTEAYEQTRSEGYYGKNPGTDVAIIQMTSKAPTANSKGLRLGSFDQIRGLIDEELEGVWSGDKTAQAALDSAVARGNRLLRRFEQANR
jgi:sn-glycerol 3-phosphate transport system substrate-binding protein